MRTIGAEVKRLNNEKAIGQKGIQGLTGLKNQLGQDIEGLESKVASYQKGSVIMPRGTYLAYQIVRPGDAANLAAVLDGALERVTVRLSKDGLAISADAGSAAQAFAGSYAYAQASENVVVIISAAKNVFEGEGVTLAFEARPLGVLAKSGDVVLSVIVNENQALASVLGQEAPPIAVPPQFDLDKLEDFSVALQDAFDHAARDAGFLPDLKTGGIPSPVLLLGSVGDDFDQAPAALRHPVRGQARLHGAGRPCRCRGVHLQPPGIAVSSGMLLRLAAAVLAVFACASLLAGAKHKPKHPRAAPPPSAAQAPAAPAPQPKPPPPPQPPSIPLCAKLRLVIRPTLLGLVPPDDPEDYGEVLVRVTALDGDKLRLRYEIKERVLRQVAVKSVFAETPPAEPERASLVPQRRAKSAPAAPELTKTVEATRIRRGLIEAQREPSAHRAEPPLFWGDGDWQTQSGLLWLSGAAYAELVDSGRTPWDPAPSAWEDSPALSELTRLLAKLRQARGLAEDAPVQLELRERQARYPAYVNGVQVNLPCLTATDSLGLAQYWILADPANPLLLKLTYVTGSGEPAAEGQGGGTTAAASGAEPQSDPASPSRGNSG